MLRQMSHEEIGERLGITAKRVWQHETMALAKMHALLLGEELDDGGLRDPDELRRVIAHCRNALRDQPRRPDNVKGIAHLESISRGR